MKSNFTEPSKTSNPNLAELKFSVSRALTEHCSVSPDDRNFNDAWSSVYKKLCAVELLVNEKINDCSLAEFVKMLQFTPAHQATRSYTTSRNY